MKKHFIIALSCLALFSNQTFCQIAAGIPLTVSAPLGGNIGIGTTLTSAKLEILGTNTQLRLSNTAAVFSEIKTDASGNLIFTQPTSGKIGFGTTSPIVNFHANVGPFVISDPAVTNRGFQVVPSRYASGEMSAGTLLLSNCSTAGEGLAISTNGTGLAGVKLGAYAYAPLDGGWKSIWETANVSSGLPNLLLVKGGGNVGIGTTTPTSHLDIVNGNLAGTAGYKVSWLNLKGNAGSGNMDNLEIFHNRVTAGSNWYSSEIKIQKSVDGLKMHYIAFRGNPGDVSTLNFGIGNVDQMSINNNGQVSIGTLKQTGTHSDAKLSVDGKIVSKEIIVTMSNWADYVFAKNYKLNSLEFIEKYIKENNHLPNVPSASEIGENGLNLAEISKIQMEKIEELTIYVIELKKEIEAIKKANK